MSRESKATKDEIQRNRDEAYQNGWGDGYAEGYGKATEDAIAALPAAPAEDVRAGALKEAAHLCWEDNAFDLQQRILALIPGAKP